jgi:hypothetical protein
MKVARVVAYDRKTPTKHKENKTKHVEEEGKLRRGRG